MINHCAVACPVVSEAVKAATPESKIAMALAAIESDKISCRAAAERFGVPKSTIIDKAAADRIRSAAGEDAKPKGRKGKDGKTYKPPAASTEIAKAWEMKDSGMSASAIAQDLGRGERTVRNWFNKERPQAPAVAPAAAPALAPDPELEPLIPESPSVAQKPQRVQIPNNLKQAHRKERQWINERWIPIAQHLAEAHRLLRLEHRRLQSEYAGPQGSLLMVNRWEAIAKLWAESGDLVGLATATGNPDTATLAELLAELERSARVSGQLIGSIEIWTGCKPDLTRYQTTHE